MTQHLMHEDDLADRDTMHRLAVVIGCFVAATASMAVIIGIVAG